MNSSDLSDDEVQADDLTWREQDILLLLSDRLTNREIAGQLHLAESTVKDYVGKILNKLDVKNRRQAVEKGKRLGLTAKSSGQSDKILSNLPSEATPFIGRLHELRQIREKLLSTRLLTLTGPGGIGKTRLALKACEEAVPDFEQGAFFVSLASIHSVNDIIQTIAEALNFPLATHEDPQIQLIRYLKKREILLVMDNFEHLMEAVPIVSQILQAAPPVKILATSREKLNLQSETNLNISGMDIPKEFNSQDPERNDAIALFLQSARKLNPSFNPAPDELLQIRSICQMVQGMPLAIELAAAWVKILTVNEILEELDKGIDILSTDVQDIPERHQSINAVFDYSWSLLHQSEQEIFKGLSVFRGGFSKAAAQRISGASLQQLLELVNKSFLSYDPHSGRMEMHTLLRQYAQARHEKTSTGSNSAQEAHASYFSEFMQEKWQQLKDNRQLDALNEIDADIENVRTAWRFYLDQKNPTKLQMFMHSLWLIYMVRGWNHAGMELFENAVEALNGMKDDAQATLTRALAMANQAFFMAWLGLADKGYPLAKESVEILSGLDDMTSLVIACNSLSINTYYVNRPNEEKEAVDKVLKIAREPEDKWTLANALYLASMSPFRVKDYAAAKQLAEESLKLSEELGEVIVSAWPLTALGQIAFLDGDLLTAKNYYLRCLNESKEMGFRWAIGNSIKYLGQIALLEDDVAEAEGYFIQSLRIAHEIGLERDIANHLFEFAKLRAVQGRSGEAAELLTILLQLPASHQARLDKGRIRDIGKALLEEIEDGLSPEVFSSAVEGGKGMDLDDVVAGLLEGHH